MIKFIKSLQDIYPQDLKKAFIKLHDVLIEFEDKPFEKRAFLYLDIISWLESKIEKTKYPKTPPEPGNGRHGDSIRHRCRRIAKNGSDRHGVQVKIGRLGHP